MRLKVISCEVLFREVSTCAAQSPHIIDLEFTEKNAHDRSDFLRGLLQEKIDSASASDKGYDAILLVFGLCGNAAAGLQSRTVPLVIPRAHDCCTLFLGSKEKFRENFAENPSMPFSSAGYMERGGGFMHNASTAFIPGISQSFAECVAQYGEENAKYIWETINTSMTNKNIGKIVFIEVPQFAHLGFAEKCRIEAEAEGLEYIQLSGDISLIDNLLKGRWDDEDFLVVPPGGKIGAVYDWDRVLQADL